MSIPVSLTFVGKTYDLKDVFMAAYRHILETSVAAYILETIVEGKGYYTDSPVN